MGEFLWYIPNTVEPGHRGDDVAAGWADLERSVTLARMAEDHGWGGALFGTGWGRPDTFTVATALAARTTTFQPLIAIRPGYWQPAHFASAAATLDHLTGGRVLVNIVSGHDNLAAYGDREGDRSAAVRADQGVPPDRAARCGPRRTSPSGATTSGSRGPRWRRGRTGPARPHPRLYFGGASAAAEQVAATEADVQLFWGEPLDGIAARIDRLHALTETARPRCTRRWSSGCGSPRGPGDHARRPGATPRPGWPRWPAAQAAPRRVTGRPRAAGRSASSACSTWPSGARSSTPASTPRPAGSAAAARAPPGWSARHDEVAAALRKYADLGITHFILSDTPYKRECARVGDELLPRLRTPLARPAAPPAPTGG